MNSWVEKKGKYEKIAEEVWGFCSLEVSEKKLELLPDLDSIGDASNNLTFLGRLYLKAVDIHKNGDGYLGKNLISKEDVENIENLLKALSKAVQEKSLRKKDVQAIAFAEETLKPVSQYYIKKIDALKVASYDAQEALKERVAYEANMEGSSETAFRLHKKSIISKNGVADFYDASKIIQHNKNLKKSIDKRENPEVSFSITPELRKIADEMQDISTDIKKNQVVLNAVNIFTKQIGRLQEMAYDKLAEERGSTQGGGQSR